MMAFGGAMRDTILNDQPKIIPSSRGMMWSRFSSLSVDDKRSSVVAHGSHVAESKQSSTHQAAPHGRDPRAASARGCERAEHSPEVLGDTEPSAPLR